ncbi:hypothetical protein ACFYZI_13810 [Streptomyces griseorubiginosus]|jgi:hypothetical protein|uniref:Secreted protein n=1 Tax=Streptomyces griseorubiginosus TaxID=67304 RepID=A0AAI8L4M1_9ACTN|nr:hypothetical protein [Streptomyces griseorubiginosus]AYC41260.1 hypothetical protein DWG14_05544 [Streptomyces griseorubiginosus]
MRMKRALAAAGVTVAAMVVPLTVAAPAQASAADCRNYLASQGYIVGPKVKEACAQTGITGYQGCVQRLLNIGVRSEHALIACSKR